MKKIYLMMMLTLITLVLAACGGGESEDQEGSDEAQAPGEKTQIEYWHVNAETQGGESVDKLVEDFNAQSDTVEVVARYNPDMYAGLMSNLQGDVAAGNTPAVVQVGWAFLDYFSENFHYTEPQEVIEQHHEEDADFLEENFLPNVLDLAVNSDGSQVGVPYSLSTPVLYLNEDMLEEAGLDPAGPKTWEEVQEYAKTIKEETDNYGIYIQEPADTWGQQAIVESNGANFIEDGQAAFASEEGIEAFEYYQDLVVEDESALHIGWDQGIQSFIDGNVGMLFTTIAQRNNVQSNSEFNISAIESPSWEGEERRLPAGGAMLAITAEEEDQQSAAWEFMRYLYSVEGISEWTKGTGYVPPREGVADNPDGLQEFLEENEMMQPAISQMDSVVPWASFPGDAGLEAEQKLLDMRDVILGGDVDVEETVTNTEDEINELLD
ncbi:ABC transporter substrate-binding protein [Salinicoccus sp. YB14-2]|uniref:ABC transporter substrate-binding protein n=1 Tax=Salinicoccus sp. YB14-2 TaxID=1572701 RepID=UPI0006895034|nr:ABC transporter substrate-binding protein [Salinicoccus sp. YB14-2]